jgi:hypothetical protein
MATSARKSVQLKVSVTPELHERLRTVAAQLGQAPATVASLAIGQFVANLVRSWGATEKAIDTMAASVGAAVSDELRQMKITETKP